jgi:hypothetical protein
MSTWAERTVPCSCGESIRTMVADALHISRLPAVRQRVLDRTFHRVACPRCGRIQTIDKKLLYTDFPRHHWIGVCPVAWAPLWSGLERSLRAEFERVVGRAAPPAIRALAPRFQVRLVFGCDQLAEKLYAFDAGLDDRIVELVKLRILAKHPGLVIPGVQMLLLPPEPGCARLEFEVFRRGVPGFSRVGCDRALYDGVMERRDEHRAALPDLDAAFTGLDRMLYPALADDEARLAGELWSEILPRREPSTEPPPGSPGSVVVAPVLPVLPEDRGR